MTFREITKTCEEDTMTRYKCDHRYKQYENFEMVEFCVNCGSFRKVK